MLHSIGLLLCTGVSFRFSRSALEPLWAMARAPLVTELRHRCGPDPQSLIAQMLEVLCEGTLQSLVTHLRQAVTDLQSDPAGCCRAVVQKATLMSLEGSFRERLGALLPHLRDAQLPLVSVLFSPDTVEHFEILWQAKDQDTVEGTLKRLLEGRSAAAAAAAEVGDVWELLAFKELGEVARMLTSDADVPAQTRLQALLAEPQTWLLPALANLSEQQRPAAQYASNMHSRRWGKG